jgi:uncharacterized coiled-coil DUF342 family protein
MTDYAKLIERLEKMQRALEADELWDMPKDFLMLTAAALRELVAENEALRVEDRRKTEHMWAQDAERSALRAEVERMKAAALAKDPASGQYREYDELVAERDDLRNEVKELAAQLARAEGR